MIKALQDKRAELRTTLDGILETVHTEQRDKLTADEQARFDAGESEIRGIDERVSELDEQIRADDAAAEVTRRYTSVQVTSEPEVYRKGAQLSYFRDLYRATNKGDHRAAERLERNNRMVMEKRAISTTTGAGGEFVPPDWMEDQFIAYVRPGRITANLVPTQDLPPGTDSINIPKVNTGTAVAPQSSQNTGVQQTDLTTTSVASPVVTIAGGQTVSLQLIEQSPLNIDDVVLRDLAADYAKQVNTQVLLGPGTGGQMTGITTLAGTNAVTVGTTTIAALYSGIANAIQLIHTQRFLPPTAVIMHPRRWAWLMAQLDSQSRPLVVPAANAPMNVLADMGPQAAQGYVGSILGLPVYVDALLPTNLGAGTNQDEIIVAKMDDLILWEGGVKAEAFQQTYAQNLSVFVRLYNYTSFQPARYPKSIAVIGGVGLAQPSF